MMNIVVGMLVIVALSTVGIVVSQVIENAEDVFCEGWKYSTNTQRCCYVILIAMLVATVLAIFWAIGYMVRHP